MKQQLKRTLWATAMMIAVSSTATGCSQKSNQSDSTTQSAAETIHRETQIAALSSAVYDDDDKTDEDDSFDAEITLDGEEINIKSPVK